VPTRAIVREISGSFVHALAGEGHAAGIHVGRARAAHAVYVSALRDAGLTVEILPADERFPDAVFVEDCAVIAGGVALLTRPGAPSRRGETDAVAVALGRHLPVQRMEAPATMDGGDVLVAGDRLYVGRSSRTNEAGLQAARALGLEVIPVEVPGWLHLKCVVSLLGEGRLLLAAETIPPSVFDGLELVLVPREEAHAANVVVVGDTALVAAGFPATAAAVRSAGLRVVEIDTTELRKADGSLTCQSILF
jgi:dimethylargininase